MMYLLSIVGYLLVALGEGFPVHDSTHPDYHIHKENAKSIDSLWYNMF